MRKKVLILGGVGMVGSAVARRFDREHGQWEVVSVARRDCDLTDAMAVEDLFAREKPEVCILCAAKVGGIYANNTFPVQFITDNVLISVNCIKSAHAAGVEKFINLGSSCIYPKYSDQPIHETSLLKGSLEPTNEPYAIAKIAAIKACESYNRQHSADFRSLMPCNLYGPGDNFHPTESHVIPGLIRRFHEAKASQAASVVVWGTGRAKREFLYVDDLADACHHFTLISKDEFWESRDPQCSHVNVGVGSDVSIEDLAFTIAKVVGYAGTIEFDPTKPDGPPKKLLDVTDARRMGWRSNTELEAGLIATYSYFKEEYLL